MAVLKKFVFDESVELYFKKIVKKRDLKVMEISDNIFCKPAGSR